MNIAIIPARSGSKGVKNKNIRNLNGKPLMAYSIEAALQSGIFDTVMVSTDSEEYAGIAKKYGAEVPFLRSAEYATDQSSSNDAIFEVLRKYQELGKNYDTLCILQPTSPLRGSDDIKKAYELYMEKDAFSVISVCESEHPFEWYGRITEDLSLDGFISRDTSKRRQEAGKFYRLNGAIYLAKADEFRKDPFLYRERSYAYIMERSRSVDIDTEDDFLYAEFVITRTGVRQGDDQCSI